MGEAQRRDVILHHEVVGHQSTPEPVGVLFDRRFWSGGREFPHVVLHRGVERHWRQIAWSVRDSQ